MALRITGVTADPVAPASDPQQLLAELAAHARAQLAASDLDGYAARLADAAALEDVQRRYQARVALLEQGLLAAGQAGDRGATRIFAAVAEGALRALEDEPAEPLLLAYAGVCLYELWALDAARDLFKAALRLDPGLPDVAGNLAQLAQRAREHRPARPLHPAVPGLRRRASSVARRARPTRGLTLSLCMIVRDEAQMLGRCLQAAAPAVDEIVIVDTGSTDATVEIARSFGARVLEREWTGSFADARNASFAAATGDWLIYLDADEVLIADDAARLRELTGHTWREAMDFIETSFVGELGDGSAVVNTALRMFRNRPQYRFSGEIHEQIADTLPTWAPGRFEHTSVRIEHYGYLGDTRAAKDKSTRNLELLRRQRDATDSPSPFLHFNLGCEYAAAGRSAESVEELTTAWERLETAGLVASTEYAPTLLSTLVRVLRLSGRHEEALRWAEIGLERFADLTDLVLEQAAAHADAGRHDEAVALCERCMTLGDAPARYGGLVGTGTYLPRLALARIALDRSEVATGVALLDWCVEHHPSFTAVAGPYATARLRAGDPPEQVVAELQDRLGPLTVAARTSLARALISAGASRVAEAQYEAIVAARPSAHGARVALAQLLLHRAAWRQAADLAAQVPDGDPYAALACRIETAGRIAAGDAGGARAAAARGALVGLSAGEREVLSAWVDTAAADGPVRSDLPAAGVPLLVTMLELMLSAGERVQYARLRALLERSRLPARERVQLLAEAHLRHGDLQTAGAMWLRVCAETPDARARLGLAEVAAASGMQEDAVLFARAALELDPATARAHALLERLSAAPVPALDR